MEKRKKIIWLEKFCYVAIFFLIISILFILIIKNKDLISNFTKAKGNEVTEVDYSEGFSIESLKRESLMKGLKDNVNELAVLVNKDNEIGNKYIPTLIEPNVPLVGKKGEEKNMISKEMKIDLEKMFKDAKNQGVVDMLLNSAYRSYESQKNVYSVEVSANKEEGNKLVAKPGESEHQTGLAIDITTASINFDVSSKFENTDAYKWLSNNAHKYGFILRYPKDKTNVTQYQYEPWHYRYVGDKELSTYIYENNLTLEEVYQGIN